MNIDALHFWVTESTRGARLPSNSKTIEQQVQKLLNIQEPLKEARILYRVHSENSKTIIPYSWFATSSDLNKVLRQHLSTGASCCLFKIIVEPGVRILDVDKTLKNAGKKATGYDESEVIVDGHGIFTHPKSESGFYEISDTKGVTTFETHYEVAKNSVVKRKMTTNEVFNIILPNEYNLIDSINNVKESFKTSKINAQVNNAVFENVWKRIQNIKNKKMGGRRKRMTRRKKRASNS